MIDATSELMHLIADAQFAIPLFPGHVNCGGMCLGKASTEQIGLEA